MTKLLVFLIVFFVYIIKYILILFCYYFDMKDIFLLGIQWCWKGTQAKLLLKHFEWKFDYLEMGQLFRANMSNDNIIWNFCKDIVNWWGLVPPFVSFGWYEIALQIVEWKNVALMTDGFPRSIEQAKFMESMMEKYHRDFKIVHYELSREKAIERIMSRAQKEWRADDNEESIKVRLAAFENETLPVINYFKKKWKVITIDADNQIDDIFNETIKLLN